jgi:hypothetical protein
MSIDPPDVLRNVDADPELEEDLSVNEIESISEMVLEQAFDIENAVPETDDPDSDNFVKKVEIFSPFEKCYLVYFSIVLSKNPTTFFYSQLDLVTFWSEIVNPPPEV